MGHLWDVGRGRLPAGAPSRPREPPNTSGFGWAGRDTGPDTATATACPVTQGHDPDIVRACPPLTRRFGAAACTRIEEVPFRCREGAAQRWTEDAQARRGRCRRHGASTRGTAGSPADGRILHEDELPDRLSGTGAWWTDTTSVDNADRLKDVW
jgi:hypothetical protein